MNRFGARRVPAPSLRDDLPKLPDLPPELGLGNITEADAYYALWKTGIGLELLLHEKQLDLATMFFALPAMARLFLLIARKWGKTILAIWLAEKIARSKRNAILRFAYPTKEQAKTIILPAWEEIAATCPPELRWQNREQTDGCWYLPHTGARLYMAGTDTKDQVDRLRGPRSDFTVIDEPGSHGCDLKYLVNSILAPQLLTTRGKMLFITTPPVSMEHGSVYFINAARANGLLVEQTIHDVPESVMPLEMKLQWCRDLHPDLTEKEVLQVFEGDREGDPAWEREAMVRLVSDKGMRVTPEFIEREHVGEHPKLRYRDRYVLGDAGFAKDFFALLFCELDWGAGVLWVCREWVRKRVPTAEMVKEALAIEAELWPASEPRAPTEHLHRLLDADPRTIADLCALKYNCRFAGKSDGAEKMVKPLSNRLHAGNVKVDKACSKFLIPQLRDGIFKIDATSGQKVDFLRTASHGHLDALAALAGGIPNVHWNHNPAPPGYLHPNFDSVKLAPVEGQHKTQIGRAVSKAIGLRWRLRRG